jgi:hypothetical protein
LNWIAAILAAFAAWGCASTQEYFQDAGATPPARERTLADWPYKEIWTGVVFNGAKIGLRAFPSPAPRMRRSAGTSSPKRRSACASSASTSASTCIRAIACART